MKTITIALFILLSSICTVAQTEEDAIKKLLSDETTAFFKHNFIAAFSYWHVVPQSSSIIAFAGDKKKFFTSKDLTPAAVEKALSNNVSPDSFERTNWNFIINGTNAYVTFFQTTYKKKALFEKSYEARYMEKVSGVWKIVSSSVAFYKN